MIKLIAIDIDGTLLDSRGKIPAANLMALEEAAAGGIHIAVVTGRSFSFALPAVQSLPDPLTLVVHNGAIARTRQGETLIRRLLPRVLAREVLASTREWRDCALVLFDREHSGQMLYDRMDWQHPLRVRFRKQNLKLMEEVATLEEALIEDPIQVAFNGGVDAMRAIVACLTAHTSAPALAVSLTEYRERDFSLVDVCAAGTTKGATLAVLAAMLGIAQAEVMAVGDNHNDRDMLAWAGVGVAMGNAAPEVKEGCHVTGTHDEAGLAQAIRRFAL